MKLAYIGTDNKESFPEMVARMTSEGDHGHMTKDEWDALVAKWMNIYTDIKNNEKSPLLMSWEDIQKMY
jgi:hypothetical protein